MNYFKEKLWNLRGFNLLAGVLHLLQGLYMLRISNDTSVELTTNFLNPEIIDGEFIAGTALEGLVDFKLGPAVALFLFLSAFAHLMLCLPGIYEWYRRNLAKGINHARWFEYSLSSSLMIILIAILSGMYDAPSLVLLFTLNATMIWFGHVMEIHNQTTTKTNWISYIYGCVAGIVPWIVVGWYFFAALSNVSGLPSDVDVPPVFVYFILGTLFVFFNTFALNMFLQYKKVGPWRNYIFGEKMYIILSLLAKTALAWQVFGGTLR